MHRTRGRKEAALSVKHKRDAKTFGAALRNEREARGVELTAIVEETKIPRRFLEALEQGRLSVLPGGMFPLSFLRQYADHLDLDSDPLLDELESLLAEPKLIESRPSMSGSIREHRGNLVLLAILAAVGVLALLKLRSEQAIVEAVQSPASRVATPRTPTPVRNSLPARNDDRVYPRVAPTVEPAPQNRLRLALTARQPSWVAVSVDGQTVIDRIFARGESQIFEAESEIVLSVGNAGGVAFTVNDQPGIVLGRVGQVRRDIHITPESLPSLVENTPGPSRLADRG